jgi:ATP-binding cassette subfamily F protein uup
MGVLEDYLRNFEGCLIVVSHDRYFMDKMVDHLFVFEGNGVIKDILGNYTEYRKVQSEEGKKEKQDKKTDTPEVAKVLVDPAIQANGNNQSNKRKLSFKEQEEYKQLEQQIDVLENEKALLTDKLTDSTLGSEELMQAGQRLAEIVQQLEEKTDRWLELSEFI